MKKPFILFIYGLLIFVITLALLFVLSLIAGSDQPVDFWWIGVIIAILITLVSLWFSRRLHPATTRQALTYGIVWAIMLAVILLIIAIPNGTTSIIFGQWSMYLVFIGVAIGPILLKPNNINK